MILFKLPWNHLFFTINIPIEQEQRNNFIGIIHHGTLLLSESLENSLKIETFSKDLKKLFPQSIELNNSFCGLLSFCPLKDCFLLYKLSHFPLDSFFRIEFFILVESLPENIQKYRDVCKGLFLDINHYFEN